MTIAVLVLCPSSFLCSLKRHIAMCTVRVGEEQHKFYEDLVKKEPKNLDIVLRYEESNAYVGVKRKSFEGTKGTFTETDIDALLRDKENVCIAQLIRSGPPVHTGDEL